MDGIGGKKGWAWIFVLEGLATILVGIISFAVVCDFPDEARFLSDLDRQRVIRRLKGKSVPDMTFQVGNQSEIRDLFQKHQNPSTRKRFVL